MAMSNATRRLAQLIQRPFAPHATVCHVNALKAFGVTKKMMGMKPRSLPLHPQAMEVNLASQVIHYATAFSQPRHHWDWTLAISDSQSHFGHPATCARTPGSPHVTPE